MVDHVKIFLTSSLITMQNSVVVSDTVCAHVGHKILGDTGAPPTLDGGIADLETRYYPTSYTRTKFRR